MEGPNRRQRVENNVRRIELVDDSKKRALIPPQMPYFFVNNTLIHFAGAIGEDCLRVRIVVLSNKADASQLSYDEEASDKLSFHGVGEILAGPSTFNGAVTWKGAEYPGGFTSVSHAKNKGDPVVFAIGLMLADQSSPREVIAQTECFFVVSNSAHKKKSKLFTWVTQNIERLIAAGFVFQKERVPEGARPAVQPGSGSHTCAQLVAASSGNLAPFPCCLQGVRTHPEMFEQYSFLDTLALDDYDGVGLGDSLDLDNLPHYSASVDSESKLRPCLVQKFGDSWGQIGRDISSGLPLVKVESQIGIKISPKDNVLVTVYHTSNSIDRERRVFPVREIQGNGHALILPLPIPKALGVEVVDVVADKSEPATIVYKVVL